MLSRFFAPLLPVLVLWSASRVGRVAAAGEPFLKEIDSKTHVIGNDLWNLTVGEYFGTKLWYKGYDLVGNASGHYVSYNGAANNLSWTLKAPYVHRKADGYLDIAFSAKEGDVHFVLTPTLAGAYQYFVNRALPRLGEFRTLWRLDNSTFTHGFTVENNLPLPPLCDFHASKKVQDETWQRPNGSFITKYDLSTFLPVVDGNLAYWGVYGKLPSGEGVGSWYIHGGKDYFNGDHLKQELMVHRESITGDAVQLNMLHGTHFQAFSGDEFGPGRTWGPWLWLLNDGSPADAAAKAKEENAAWPHAWFQDENGFRNRSTVSGRLVVSDGRPADGAAVFLGDKPDSEQNVTTLDQGRNYYYRTYTDSTGKFSIPNVREGVYYLSAWSNGGNLGNITAIANKDVDVRAGKNVDLGDIPWQVQDHKLIWQIGSLDRKAAGFAHAGPPHEHARAEKCPANLTYTIGTSSTKDWCFAQWTPGTWTILFSLPAEAFRNSTSGNAAVLSVSLAGYSSGVKSEIAINNVSVFAMEMFEGQSKVRSDPSLYRSATLAGEWRFFEFLVAGGSQGQSVLREGANRIDFKVRSGTQWRGLMWDSILLEWS